MPYKHFLDINMQITGRRVKLENIEAFMQTLQSQEYRLTEFDGLVVMLSLRDSYVFGAVEGESSERSTA